MSIPSDHSAGNNNHYHRGASVLSVNSGRSVSSDDGSQLFFVTSYSDFDRLAHGPRGTAANHSVYLYRFDPSDGSLVLLNIQGNDVVNPAFSRFHPKLNVVYTCTEDCDQNGLVYAYHVSPTGELKQLGQPVDAGGTSTCYLTIDKAAKHMLCVNYWNSTLTVLPLDPETGTPGPIQSTYDPKQGQQVVAGQRCKGGVNHSNNDESTIRMRQADPHSHALVLDPYQCVVAYVPDLGKDVVREFFYDKVTGKIGPELNVLPSGLCTGHPDGPRYFEFHPQYNVAYVVNELSSTIAVFEVDRTLLSELQIASRNGADMNQFKGRSTLRLVQSIKTTPAAFPNKLNTCGRICVHQSGRFVVVSNRGHQSIAIFRVCTKAPNRGELVTVGYFHTRGETPRHFQFDASGQYLLVANQDTDSLAVFNFNLSSGMLTYTGNEYRVPSPNFVCCCPLYDHRDDELEELEAPSLTASEPINVVPVVSNMQVVTDSHSLSDGSEIAVAESSDQKTAALAAELERARQEIAELKLLLASQQNGQ